MKECPECTATVPSQVRECAICGYEWPLDVIDDEPAAVGLGGDDDPKTRAALIDFVMTEVDLLASSPFKYESLFNGLVSMASAMDAWAIVISYHGRWHAIGGSKESGIHHLADNGDRLLSMAQADDFLRENGDSDAAHKAKRWMTEPPSVKQLELLGLPLMKQAAKNDAQLNAILDWEAQQDALDAKERAEPVK